MNTLNIGDNIIRLRHKKKMTQQQLADFIGVTKASVSKWETRQSTPDIILLPLLAAFFNVSVDELIGYEPQLSKEQIASLYQKLAASFAEGSFEGSMEESEKLVKQYYSCFPFLFQIGILWLNHLPLAKDKDRQTQILTAISDLCSHILSSCKDLSLCSDTTALKAYADIQLGRIQETIQALEELLHPWELANESDMLLVQAYLLAGDSKKADAFAQTSMYRHLLSLIGNSTIYLSVHSNDFAVCEQTIDRIERILDVYALEHLHPNAASQFYYQAAAVCISHGKRNESLDLLKKCSNCLIKLLSEDGLKLHGDDYFNLMEEKFSKLGIKDAPRNRKLIVRDIRHLFDNPVFADLETETEFQKLKRKLKEAK